MVAEARAVSTAARANVVLAAMVGALALLLSVAPAREPAPEHALSAMRPAQARSVRLERRGVPPIPRERSSAGWRLVAPFAERAEELAVGWLLAILEAKSAQRFPADNPARFALEVDGQRFVSDILSEVARAQYVATGDAVHAVGPRYGALLPIEPAALASRALFGPDEIVLRIEFAGFAVAQRDGRWVVTPARADATESDIARWLEGWRRATAVRVELAGGARRALGMLARDPEFVLVRSAKKLRSVPPAARGRQLLSPPAPGRPAAARER